MLTASAPSDSPSAPHDRRVVHRPRAAEERDRLRWRVDTATHDPASLARYEAAQRDHHLRAIYVCRAFAALGGIVSAADAADAYP